MDQVLVGGYRGTMDMEDVSLEVTLEEAMAMVIAVPEVAVDIHFDQHIFVFFVREDTVVMEIPYVPKVTSVLEIAEK